MEAERSIPKRNADSSTPTGEFMASVATVMPSQPYPGEKPMTKRLYTARHWMAPAQSKQTAADAHGRQRPPVDGQARLLHGTGVLAHGPQGKAEGRFIEHPRDGCHAEQRHEDARN